MVALAMVFATMENASATLDLVVTIARWSFRLFLAHPIAQEMATASQDDAAASLATLDLTALSNSLV